MIRYFRANPAVYAAICEQLDAAYGYPKPQFQTDRVLPLASDLPSDGQGRLYLSIAAEYCEYALPTQMLADLLASGAVEEIAEEEYRSVAAA